MATGTSASALFDSANRANPYPLYEELRETGEGAHFIEPMNSWVLLRYDHLTRLSRDRGHWSSDVFGTDIGFGAHNADDPEHQRFAQVAKHNLIASDAPVHTRLRALVGHAFTGRAAKSWGPAIDAVATEVLDTITGGEEIEVVSRVAEVMPVWVISRLLGVPISDRERFRRLSVAFTETFDPTVVGERRDRAIRDSVELFDYVRKMAEQRRTHPGEDLLSTLLHAEEQGDRLTIDELVATVCMLLVAGNETTADVIASGLALLLSHPAQLDALRADPTLVDSAVLEVLRYESPLQFTGRVAAQDVQLGPHTVEKGVNVFFCLASANRDPRQFDRADEFDIRRGDRRHLAFGAGPHFCIGNQLALAEAGAFLRHLLARSPAMELTGPAVVRTDRFYQRGYAMLPVAFATRATV